ncbi:MAG: DUF1799 domain-containing protein [Proteobacteria bacterium]|nr:DUF1799 domain-containing protein [Pseudomonadota bacterium]
MALGGDPQAVMETWTGRSDTSDEDWLHAVENGRLVLPAEIEPSVRAFTLCATQWRWIATAWDRPRRVGLDYAAAAAALRMARLKVTPALFEDLRFLEAEALQVLAQ